MVQAEAGNVVKLTFEGVGLIRHKGDPSHAFTPQLEYQIAHT